MNVNVHQRREQKHTKIHIKFYDYILILKQHYPDDIHMYTEYRYTYIYTSADGKKKNENHKNNFYFIFLVNRKIVLYIYFHSFSVLFYYIIPYYLFSSFKMLFFCTFRLRTFVVLYVFGLSISTSIPFLLIWMNLFPILFIIIERCKMSFTHKNIHKYHNYESNYKYL